MDSALILNFIQNFLLLTVVWALIASVVWWARRKPNRSKEYPEQIRLPKIVPIVGWMFLAMGLLMASAAFTSDDADDPLAFRIASVAVFLGGLAFVMMYRNWYVAPRVDEVAFRTVLGREHVVPYSDIATYHVVHVNGQPILKVKSIHGARLTLNLRTFDVPLLAQAIQFHEAYGRWPGRGEMYSQGPGGVPGP